MDHRVHTDHPSPIYTSSILSHFLVCSLETRGNFTEDNYSTNPHSFETWEETRAVTGRTCKFHTRSILWDQDRSLVSSVVRQHLYQLCHCDTPVCFPHIPSCFFLTLSMLCSLSPPMLLPLLINLMRAVSNPIPGCYLV